LACPQKPGSKAGGSKQRFLNGVVSQAASLGDQLASEVLETAGWALGVGIGNVANLMNPQRFVLGGGVTKAGASLWEVVRRVARETALPEVNCT
jgi:glucokinase